ncbi:MAG: AAA family ATPase [Acidimicrobiales bacterium]
MGDETKVPTSAGSADGPEVTPAAADDVRISVLGAVTMLRAGAPVRLSNHRRRTLAILAVAGPEGQTIDWLAEQLWTGDLPSDWRGQVRVAVNRLAHAVALPVRSDGGRYRLPVPHSAVDAWELLELDRTCPGWDPRFEAHLAEVDLTRSIETFPALEAAQAGYRAAQHAAIARLARHPEPPQPRHLLTVARHHLAHPEDEALCAAAALLHARADRTDEAVAIIDRTAEARRAVGAAPSSRLGALRDAIAGGTIDLDGLAAAAGAALAAPQPALAHSPSGPAGRAVAEPAAVPAPDPAPGRPNRFRADHFVGRGQELDVLQGLADPGQSSVVVVRGRAACGKTTLLAEAIYRATEAGAHVVRVAGSEGGRVGLGPFSSVLPAFRSLAADLSAVADSLPGRGVLAARLLDVLETEAAGRPLVLVVDDAHWLDSMSCDAVEYLAHAAADGALSLVVAARPDTTEAPWVALEQALDRVPGAAALTLEPFTEAEMAELVDLRRPQASFASRAQLTRWLHHASGGLPGVANALLDEGADGADLPPTPRPDVNQVYDRRLAPLSEDARQVGGAAAVLGSSFLITELGRLLERTEDSLEPTLAELVRHGLLVEGEELGAFELSHQLVADAFLRSLLSTRRARLHQRAAELADSVHDLARHLVAARTLVPPELAGATAISSAREHLATGAYWEAVAAFRTAIDVGAAGLDVAALVDYATALSLAGMRHRSVTMRARAYQRAVADGRWDLALEAALSGLPAAEISDGEHDRLSQLLAIPPEGLDPARQVRQAVNAARQAAMVGQPAEAATWADRAAELAANDDERAEAALTRRFVAALTVGAGRRLAEMESATADLVMAASARCRLAQFAALDHFACGALDRARKAHAEFEALAAATGDVQRQWHAGIFAALLHDNDGDWPAADAAADRALALGHRHGITSAGILRLAQVYFRLRLTGDLALLAGGIDAVPGDDGEGTMFAAARATILEAAGQEDDARAEAVRIARLVTGRPSAAGFGSLVIVAPLVGRYGPPSLVQTTRAMLTPFAGSAFVLGAGIGNLGPVDHILTSLDRPAGRALEQSLRRSIRQADDFAMLPWQVRYRLELAALTGSDEPRSEARALAHGTSLAALAERDPSVLPRI